MLRADEIMQMFGRAGRRGLDETGFCPDYCERGCACSMAMRATFRAALLWIGRRCWGSWPQRRARAKHPTRRAVRTQERLFTTKTPLCSGLKNRYGIRVCPCNFHTDSERARHVRRTRAGIP